MKRKREAVRPFGQLCLPPPFLPSHTVVATSMNRKDSKDVEVKLPSKSTISLSEFLSRKQSKSMHKSLQEKRNSFSTIANGSAQTHQESKEDRSINVVSVFGNFKNVGKGECLAGSSGGGDSGCYKLECPPYKKPEKGNDDPILPPSIVGANKRMTSRLVVLGDDPKPRHRPGPRHVREKHDGIFNHFDETGTASVQMRMEAVGGTTIWKGWTVKKLVAMKHGKDGEPALWVDWNGTNKLKQVYFEDLSRYCKL